jgi:hypothetical protein
MKISGEKNSTYRGVTRAVRCESRPWRAQCAVAGKTYHLGNFETEEEAARAYDNLLYYAAKDGFSDRAGLNFPQDYASDPPPKTNTTRRIILDCYGRREPQDPQRLIRVVARCAQLLRELTALQPELEAALSSRPNPLPESPAVS